MIAPANQRARDIKTARAASRKKGRGRAGVVVIKQRRRVSEHYEHKRRGGPARANPPRLIHSKDATESRRLLSRPAGSRVEIERENQCQRQRHRFTSPALMNQTDDESRAVSRKLSALSFQHSAMKSFAAFAPTSRLCG
jgi:hypothetical protein